MGADVVAEVEGVVERGSLVDYARLMEGMEGKVRAYREAVPFAHAVFDDVLFPEVFEAAAGEFPGLRDEFWKGYLHVNETKYSNTQPDTWSPTLEAVAREFCSPRFVGFLEELTGIGGLMPDWSMDGGGLHQTMRGGHLNIHADFSTHHDHEDWARRVNILLYLNTEWENAWGGKLELWDAAMTAKQGSVTPAGNRMLVFTTTDTSFHGHPDALTCPPDVARRSMALYYFTQEDAPVRRATNYRARPEDGRRKYVIAADRLAVDLYDRAKRRLNIDDAKVNALLGRVHNLRRKK